MNAGDIYQANVLGFWVTKDDEMVEITSMTTEHLANALAHLVRFARAVAEQEETSLELSIYAAMSFLHGDGSLAQMNSELSAFYHGEGSNRSWQQILFDHPAYIHLSRELYKRDVSVGDIINPPKFWFVEDI